MLPDDLWNLFGLADGPAGGWVAAEPVCVLLLPTAALLAALILDLAFGGDR